MKIAKYLALAGVLASITIPQAYAHDVEYPESRQQRRMHAVKDYWLNKDGQKAAPRIAVNGDAPTAPQASEYPCSGCTYDQKAGGWIQNIHLKR